MKHKVILLSILGIMVQAQLFAQGDDDTKQTPVDGFYRQNVREGAKPYEYPEINIHNVKFYKRIWRDIDLNDSANLVLATPGASLMDIIVEGLKSGEITAFDPASTDEDPTGDGFTTPMSAKKALGKLSDSVLVPIFDENGNQVASEMMQNEFDPQSIKKFRIKEDIFFDKQRSKVETRIVGLAPLIHIDAGGELLGEQPAFWLYFPECRKLFVTRKVVNRGGEYDNMSFDDVFIQHKFNSIIVKESNPAELSIKDYVEGEGRTKEARRIEKQIDDYKKSIWKY